MISSLISWFKFKILDDELILSLVLSIFEIKLSSILLPRLKFISSSAINDEIEIILNINIRNKKYSFDLDIQSNPHQYYSSDHFSF